ncbi:ATP synthase subunit a, chloroplastic [Gossypium arboreum]|uniref:ATP synthase subunit a, chloroplastic n=1 Tax=Gossypium arboreum TaxID=29729 RepID=A0A0B0NWS7_GOSAR|nr:ATP synthase subunit a, chloroplastic [Gossypium arboreum]KHG17265.1 ATP synthase subunit a, chloroplastic [Gossypium arboreum]
MNVLSCHIQSFNKESLMSITYIPIHTHSISNNFYLHYHTHLGTFVTSSIIIPIKHSKYYKCPINIHS